MQKRGNKVKIKFRIFCIRHAAPVQVVADCVHRFAVGIACENFQNKRCFGWVDLIIFVFVNLIAERHPTAVVLATQRILSLTAHDLFRQLRRIILRHAFKH